MRVDTSRQAQIKYICGASGSGKSWYVKEQIKSAQRLIIFDPDDEYKALTNVTVNALHELAAALAKAGEKGRLKIRIVGNGKRIFEGFARCAFAWGNCVAVAEEIAGVTSPSKAPDAWHTLVSRGRKRGITIYAVTQRPAEADKTVLGNASHLHAGRLSRLKDQKYIADELNLHIDYIKNLANLEYYERNMSADSVIFGKMGSRARPKVIR